jgi:hypothetical protein
MQNHGGMISTGKLLIRTPDLSDNQSSSSVAKEELAKEIVNLALQRIFVYRLSD